VLPPHHHDVLPLRLRLRPDEPPYVRRPALASGQAVPRRRVLPRPAPQLRPAYRATRGAGQRVRPRSWSPRARVRQARQRCAVRASPTGSAERSPLHPDHPRAEGRARTIKETVQSLNERLVDHSKNRASPQARLEDSDLTRQGPVYRSMEERLPVHPIRTRSTKRKSKFGPHRYARVRRATSERKRPFTTRAAKRNRAWSERSR
jgi:hypothetical protein